MIKKPRGTEDLFGQKILEFSALEMIIRNHMDLYNYKQINTPAFEAKDLFARSVGLDTDIVAKEMYEFIDKKGRELVLRPEGTAAVVRAVIENKLFIPENLPLKLFYLEPMYRYERPQAGRQREFNQLGVEVFGEVNEYADVELILMGYQLLKNIGLNDLELKINYLVSKKNKHRYLEQLILAISKLNICEDCIIRTKTNPLRILDCKIDHDKFTDLPNMEEFLDQTEKETFNRIVKMCEKLEIKLKKDPTLVRGLDYYTGLIFEIVSTNAKQGAQATLVGGGRYNDLVKDLDGPTLPAAGFGMGIERILLALVNENITLADDLELDIYIATISDKARFFANSLSLVLRSAGYKTDVDFMNKPLKSQFRIAERLKAKKIIIIGDEELKFEQLVVKDLTTRTEKKVSFNDILTYLESVN